MEVFIAYTKDSLVADLTKTLEAWECCEWAEPVAIEVPDKKYELIRRVTAENMSEDHYILADLGCIPNDLDFVGKAKAILEKEEKVGMVSFGPAGAVRACRKGVIERWLPYKGGSYDDSHKQAYTMEGYTTIKWPTITYRRLAGHLPS